MTAQKARDEFRARPVEYVERRAALLDMTVTHHDDEIGEGHRFFLRMRDVHEGDAEFLLPALEFGAHLHAQEGIECGERLVEQQAARLVEERARKRNALLLSARELRRLAVRVGRHR